MWNYSKKVVDHFLHPRNVGEIEKPDGMGEVGSLACGDILRFTFKLDLGGRIADARFKTFGCASAIASSSALTEMVHGKTIEEASRITNRDIAEYLGGLPEEKMHCSVMGREALDAAIANYRGGPSKARELNGEVVCKCFGVTDEEIRRVARENDLHDVEGITNYTKAGGACGECHDRIRETLEDMDGHVSRGQPAARAPYENLTNIQRMHLIEDTIRTRIRPALRQDCGDLELVDIANNTIYVRLTGACATCPSSKVTLQRFVEKEIHKLVSPDLRVEEVKS